jgi:Zn-dependent oligopeptidase
MKTIPYTAKDFTWVKISPDQIQTVGEKLIERKKIAYKQLKSVLPEKRTFENTVIAMEISEGVYGNTMSAIGLLAEVSPSKEVRDTAFKIIMGVSQKLVDIEYDRDIYISLLEYYEGNFSDEKKQLSKEDIKLLEDGIREYKRMGFDLETVKQKKLKTLLKKASEISTKFGKNINDYSDYILCNEEEIDGVPDRVKASLPRDEKSGKYIVTLQYPHIGPFMAYASSRKKREELGIKNMKKGGKKNLDLLNKLVAIRAEIASILGYAHHADFRTENRMAKKAETAAKFQDSLLKKLAPAAKRDIKELQDYAKVLGIKDFQHFDVAYVANKLAQERFNYNPEDVRAYFPVEKVIEEMFGLYKKLFGISIKKIDYSYGIKI